MCRARFKSRCHFAALDGHCSFHLLFSQASQPSAIGLGCHMQFGSYSSGISWSPLCSAANARRSGVTIVLSSLTSAGCASTFLMFTQPLGCTLLGMIAYEPDPLSGKCLYAS